MSEEAQARDRAKERKARTRRLIQACAILEAALPYAKNMALDEMKGYLFKLSQAHIPD